MHRHQLFKAVDWVDKWFCAAIIFWWTRLPTKSECDSVLSELEMTTSTDSRPAFSVRFSCRDIYSIIEFDFISSDIFKCAIGRTHERILISRSSHYLLHCTWHLNCTYYVVAFEAYPALCRNSLSQTPLELYIICVYCCTIYCVVCCIHLCMNGSCCVCSRRVCGCADLLF